MRRLRRARRLTRHHAKKDWAVAAVFVTFERAADMRRALAGHRVGLVQSTFNVHLGFWFWPLPFPSQLDWCDARARSHRPSSSPSLPPSLPPSFPRVETRSGDV